MSLTLAGRADRYSDFGTALTPKLTLQAALAPMLKLRGTWGKSFRAPLLTDLYDTSIDLSALQVLNDPHSATGQSLVLIDQKNNPNLSEEKARTWTLGMDLVPTSGFGISLTYYGIDYRNRVFRQGSSSISLETILASPEWGPLVTRNPSLATVEAICNSPTFMGVAEQCAATRPAAIIDVAPQNLSSTQLEGVDVNITRYLDTALGAFNLKLDASYILKFNEELTQGARTVRIMDKVDNPARFRTRSTVLWHPEGVPGFGVAVSVDYTGAYRDSVSLQFPKIARALTTDLNLSYRSRPGTSEWDNVEFNLNISNVLNRNPPFVDRLEGYDVANARPYGRVTGLYLTKHW
jgi:outer membrane receptor protein involved in Fe transport